LVNENPFEAVHLLHEDVNKIITYLSTRKEDMLKILDEKIVDVILKRP